MRQDDAREAVKDILREYLDWTLEEIIAKAGGASVGNWRIQMGGEILVQGEPRSLHRQIAAIGAGCLHWAIFDVAEIMAELRCEEAKARERRTSSLKRIRSCSAMSLTLSLVTGAAWLCYRDGRSGVAAA